MRTSELLKYLFLLLLIASVPTWAIAQDSTEDSTEATPEEEEEDTAEELDPADVPTDSILTDVNGDGNIDLVGFGDSITRGAGDFIPAGEEELVITPEGEAGYPLRVENLLGLNVLNLGDPGEQISILGLPRFAATIPHVGRDFVVLSGGSNDARDPIPVNQFYVAIQTMINIARATGVQVVLMTAPPACCNHRFLNGPVSSYNSQFRVLATVNELRLADVAHAFENTCPVMEGCFLLNLPEGLHPNIKGYDLIGENVIATLYGIDLFAPEGAGYLETILALPAGSVLTRPDATSGS